jgi:hypothetical protein
MFGGVHVRQTLLVRMPAHDCLQSMPTSRGTSLSDSPSHADFSGLRQAKASKVRSLLLSTR